MMKIQRKTLRNNNTSNNMFWLYFGLENGATDFAPYFPIILLSRPGTKIEIPTLVPVGPTPAQGEWSGSGSEVLPPGKFYTAPE